MAGPRGDNFDGPPRISLTSLNGTPNIDEFSMISNFIAHKKANCENVGDQFFRDLGKYLFSLAPGKEIPQRSKRTKLNFENHNDSKDCKDENIIQGVEKLANDLEYDDLEYIEWQWKTVKIIQFHLK